MHPEEEPHPSRVAERVVISSAGLDAEPRPAVGWLNAAVLELGPEDLVEQAGPIHYALEVQRFDDELLVRGEVSVAMKRVCVKTAEIFSTIVAEKGFTEGFPLIGQDEEVDLTEALREAVLLNVPTHPVNPAPVSDPVSDFRERESARLEKHSPEDGEPGAKGIWDSLDKLDLQQDD